MKKRRARRRGMRLPQTLFLLMTGLILGGCTFVQLREETRDFYAATVLAGHITTHGWRGL